MHPAPSSTAVNLPVLHRNPVKCAEGVRLFRLPGAASEPVRMLRLHGCSGEDVEFLKEMFPSASLHQIESLLASLTLQDCVEQLISGALPGEEAEEAAATDTPLTMITLLPPEPLPGAEAEDAAIQDETQERILVERLKRAVGSEWALTLTALQTVCSNLVSCI